MSCVVALFNVRTACGHEILRRSSERQTALNARNQPGNSALSLALLNKRVHVATFLLENEVELEPGVFSRRTPYNLIKAKKKGSAATASRDGISGILCLRVQQRSCRCCV